MRGIRDDDIPQILLNKVIVGKDVVAAEKELLKLHGLKRYMGTLRSKIQREHFLDHLRKYIYMYQTDCPFEVSTTNRYTITTYEAAVTARRRIKQGEMIKYLAGTLVPLSSAESADLDLTNRNFSIVLAGRKKSDQMFLGPARFSNHDCDPNGRLMMKGIDSMTVMAVKNINVGDEITVSYGDSYFGPDNVECLCHTCEVKERNGWTSKAAVTQPQSGTTTPIPDISPSTSLSKKRKRDSGASTPRTGPLKRLKVVPSPSKLQYSWTPPSTSGSEIAQEEVDGLLHDQQGLPLARSEDGELTPKRNDKGRFVPTSGKESQRQSQQGLQRRKSFPLSPPTTSASSQDSENERSSDNNDTAAASGAVTVKIEAVEKTTIETDDPIGDLINETESTIEVASPESSVGETARADIASTGDDEVMEGTTDVPNVVPQTLTTFTMMKVSTIASIEPIAEGQRAIPSIEDNLIITPLDVQTTSATHATLSIHPISDTIRVPGDYILTRKLLAQPHDRWVRCHNELCHSFFLQPNGYQTRRECPRCERHSMLYGFRWPKTDPDARKLLVRQSESKQRGRPKQNANATSEASAENKYTAYRRQGKSGKGSWVEGGGDEETRVLDHRTIHRFVLPEEEKELTRKGLLVEAEEARRLGEADFEVLKGLDGQGRRGRESTEGTPREESVGLMEGWVREEVEDEQGRRRSGRIVESRVYVNVCMKR